jgi:hypothetical protein
MNFSINSIKGVGKKASFVFSCVFLACMALSYNCKSQVIKSLYISKEGLKSLLDGVKKDKVSFQFYVNKSGELTLYAWPKKNDDEQNERTDGIALEVVKNSTPLNTSENNFLLATLNIGKSKVKDLRDTIKKTKYNYYIFEPTKGEIDGVPISHIYYNIYGIYEDPRSGSLPKTSPLAPINTKNPSPPKTRS